MILYPTDALLVADLQNDFCPAAHWRPKMATLLSPPSTLSPSASTTYCSPKTGTHQPTSSLPAPTYSAFLEDDQRTPTGLTGYIRERNLTRLFLCGLAYDFCVRYSALDGKALSFETIILKDATRPVDLHDSIAETNTALAAAGIPRIQSSTFTL